MTKRSRHFFLSLLAVVCLTGAAFPVQGATIVIINKDDPGVGLNDTTPASPVGGNNGTTLGEQRMNVFNAAAAVWAAKLSSPITIKIAGRFGPLTPCGPTSGVIGSAGPTNFYRNFTNAPRANTWYPVALASALSGTDLAAGLTDGASISASFNSNIGTAGCLTGTSWYLGLDNNHGSQTDLFVTLLHEFGHGLGFLSLASLSDGSYPLGSPDTYGYYIYDSSIFMHWNQMSNAQRLTSQVNTGKVVFDGPNVVSGATILSAGKDGSGNPNLYVPNPVRQGSSVSHYDTSATPNQLMEPSINADLTHSVDLPEDLSMKLMLDIGWVGLATAPSAPTNVVATATTENNVSITWTAVDGATNYKVLRSANGTTYSQVGNPSTNSYNDLATANTAYLYKVRANSGGSDSADSNIDLATTVIFTDATLTAGSTMIKAAHVSELRTAVNAVRTLAGSGGTTYTDATLTAGTTTVKAAHITELRTALNTPRASLGLSAVSYTDGTITAGATGIRTAHINDLRNGVK